MGRRNISAVISLKDNMSATLRGVKREQKSFQNELKRTRKQMEAVSRQKMTARMNASPAHKAIQKLRKNAKFLQAKKIVINAVAKTQIAMDKINKVKSAIKSVSKSVISPVIKVKDKVTGIISKISGKLTALAKGVAIPLTVIGGAAGAMVKGGMELEQQQISMNHFMGVGNKKKSAKEVQKMSDDYLKQLRDNANATPFETGEVIAAGTRALQISGGKTKEAMKMVKLAEDMAALNPGKTVGDAMEALADMNIGEMARLTEFGVKASSKDKPQAVQKKLEGMYAGGAEKLAESGSGLLSTITGKMKSNMADMGQSLLEPLKPVMTSVIGFVDNTTPAMLKFGESMGKGLGTAITFISDNFPKIQAAIQPVLSSVGTAFQAVMPVISSAITSLTPVFSGLFTVASTIFRGVMGVVSEVAPYIKTLIDALKPTFNAVGSALKSLGTIFNNVFQRVKDIVKGAFDTIKPLIDKIGGAINSISDKVSSFVGGVANFVTGKGKTKSNTTNKSKTTKPTASKTKTKTNATGTRYFSGGFSLVGEHGPELVQMPTGSKVYTNRETKNMTNSGGGVSINISSMVIREEADITKVAQALVREINNSKSVVV